MMKSMEFEAHIRGYDNDNANNHAGGIELQAWCSNNRVLILNALLQHEGPRTQRALRLLEIVEGEDDALAASVAEAMWERALQTVEIAPSESDHYAFAGRAAFAALREAIK